jgi:PAS domain S-box-containing protein
VAVLFTDVTERREAEEALRQSEERFRAFVTQATVGIAETQAGRFSYVNDRFCQITGYSREELLGKLISDISHPDDGPRDMKLIQRLYETGEPFVVDKRYVRPDGSLVWVLNSVTPIRAADGSISRGFAASIDVTDRKRTEEALRQSEERLQRALSIETVGVIFFDLNGGIHGANQAFERMSGYTQADFASGRVRWDQVTPPEFMEATLRSKDELQTQGQNTPYEKQYIRPDGSRWWGLFSGKRLNDQGECVEFVLDITEQKRAHEDLRKSEDQFRLFVTASSDLVYKMSADWSRMYGLSGNSSFINPAEASNSGWHSYLPAEEQPRVWAAIEQAIERKSTFELEHRVIMADGSVGWTFSRAIPVLNEQGEITEWFGAARDISLRKRAEQELQATNEQLRRTNIDLDNFIYTASHDLRAPIANIEGLLDALKHELNAEAETKGGVSTVLDMMHQSVERFKRTIAYLTDITKLQKEHAQPTTEVPLRPVVDDVLLDLQPLIEELGAQVEVNLDSCHAVSFTAKNLRSVVYNLLSNALKYRHPERPPRVQLRCRVEHGSTVLSVQDNGLGLSPDRQAGLFGMFRRFHSHVEGSGIGLYMVKRVVENMGGRIEVASEPGEGSTFSVYFPR